MSSAPCSDLSQEIVFTDQPTGGITAAKLNLSWKYGQVAPCFVERQPEIAGVTPGDYLLVLRSDGTYAKIPALSINNQAGPRGTMWSVGTGDPTEIAGEQMYDQYLNTTTGDVFQCTSDPLGTGARGSLWFDGSGTPGAIAGLQINDQYLDTSVANAGDVYWCTAAPLVESTPIRGSYWYDGAGVPGTISGELAQDQFLQTDTADIWRFQ